MQLRLQKSLLTVFLVLCNVVGSTVSNAPHEKRAVTVTPPKFADNRTFQGTRMFSQWEVVPSFTLYAYLEGGVDFYIAAKPKEKCNLIELTPINSKNKIIESEGIVFDRINEIAFTKKNPTLVYNWFGDEILLKSTGEMEYSVMVYGGHPATGVSSLNYQFDARMADNDINEDGLFDHKDTHNCAGDEQFPKSQTKIALKLEKQMKTSGERPNIRISGNTPECVLDPWTPNNNRLRIFHIEGNMTDSGAPSDYFFREYQAPKSATEVTQRPAAFALGPPFDVKSDDDSVIEYRATKQAISKTETPAVCCRYFREGPNYTWPEYDEDLSLENMSYVTQQYTFDNDKTCESSVEDLKVKGPLGVLGGPTQKVKSKSFMLHVPNDFACTYIRIGFSASLANPPKEEHTFAISPAYKLYWASGKEGSQPLDGGTDKTNQSDIYYRIKFITDTVISLEYVFDPLGIPMYHDFLQIGPSLSDAEGKLAVSLKHERMCRVRLVEDTLFAGAYDEYVKNVAKNNKWQGSYQACLRLKVCDCFVEPVLEDEEEEPVFDETNNDDQEDYQLKQ